MRSFEVGAALGIAAVSLSALVLAIGRPPPAPDDPGLRAARRAIPAGAAAEPEVVHTGVVLPRQMVEIASPRAGRLLSLQLAVGQRAEAGVVVAVLGAAEEQYELAAAEASLSTAEAERRMAKIQAAQLRDVMRRRDAIPQLVPGEELHAAKTAARAAAVAVVKATARTREQKAQVARLRARLTETSVRTPFAGTVALRYHEPGAIVQAGAPILRIIDDSELRVRFGIDEEQLPRLAVQAPVTIRLDSSPAGYPATVTSVSPEVDPLSGLVLAEALLAPRDPADSSLRAGLVVKVVLPGASAKPAVVRRP